MRRLLVVTVGAVACFIGSAQRAAAHPLAPALLQVEERDDGSTLVKWKTATTKFSDVVLYPELPPHCRAEGEPSETTRLNSTERSWVVRCAPEGLVGERIAIAGLPRSQTDVLVRVALREGRALQTVLRQDAPSFVVPASASRMDIWRDYARLGVQHILSGPDHLLFVFGLLLLVATTPALIRTVTAFTLGHSVTLSLAVLGYADVRNGPIEVLIALSVFVLAVDLARPELPAERALGRRPWLMAAAFGLLHGLGFAGALHQAGLPEHEIPSALLAFNVGIEIGQIGFVFAVLVLRKLTRALLEAPPVWLAEVPPCAVGALSALWVIERALALL